MKLKFIILLGVMFLPFAGYGDVYLSSILFLPKVDGLIHDEIPQEVNLGSLSRQYDFSMSKSDANSFLAAHALPPLGERESHSREIPQCKAKSLKRKATYRVSISDQDWLKQQTAWCRFSRQLLGGSAFCKPEKAADILKEGSFSSKEVETSDVLREWVHDEKGKGCGSVLGSQSDLMDSLKKCSENPNPESSCKESFKSQPLQTVGDGYEVVLSLDAAEERREVTNPRTETYDTIRNLTSLKIGPLTLMPIGAQLFSSFSLDDLREAFKDGFDLAHVSVTAEYQVVTEGRAQKEVKSASVSIGLEKAILKNHPLTVIIPRKDIISVEEYSDVSHERQMVSWLQNYCARPKQQGSYWLPFGHFVCFEKGADMEIFAKRVEMRFHFLDQDGTARSLTWERKAPAEKCEIVYANPYYPELGETFNCSLPDANGNNSSDRSDWEKWISDPSKDIKAFMDDSSFSDSSYVWFKTTSFIPKTLGEKPLKNFVTSQSEDVEIIGNVR